MENDVFEINNEKLCVNCFSHLEEGRPCRKCRTVPGIYGALPAGTILHGKYILGGALYYDNSYYGYYGYDLEDNERILIRELFPSGSYCVRSGKELVCDQSDNSMYMEFKKVISNFHAEVKLMSGLKESGVVLNVKNLIDENGTSYSIIQFPEKAILLSEYIKSRGGRLELREALGIFSKILTSLDVIHKSGIIHGNIRPENIVLYEKRVLLTGMNYSGFCYLETHSSPLYTDLNLYAPLEQFNKSNKRGPQTDIYSLGATFYYMLTGQFTVNIFSRIDPDDTSHRQPSIINSADIPPALVHILEKMLEIKIDNRYRDLYELCRALRSANLVNIKLKPNTSRSKSSAGVIRICIIIGICVIVIGGTAAALILLHISKKDVKHPEDNTVSEDTAVDVLTSEQETAEENETEEQLAENDYEENTAV